MATLLRFVVDDLLTDFQKLGDDANIERSQIAYWVIMFGNRLKSQHIAKRDSGQHLSIFSDVPIEVFESNSNPNEIKGRKYIRLPKSIFDYDGDGGINFVSYYIDYLDKECPPPFTKQGFYRTTPSDTRRLYMNKYEKPSPTNPYFYRVGNFVYLLGIECVNPKSIEIGLYTTLGPLSDPDFSLDSEFDFPEELLPVLKKMVLDLGRFVMMMPQERTNDGSNITDGTVPTNKIVSVNEGNEDVSENK
jgi:hypothetical protein